MDVRRAWRRLGGRLIGFGGGIAGLRGDRNATEDGYRDAMRRYRELRLDLDLGYLAIDMVCVLGPEDPLTFEAAAAARATFAHNRARTFLDQLEIALAQGRTRVA